MPAQGDHKGRPYVDVPGSGRYVGAEAQEDDGEPFEEKMQRLTAQWLEQVAKAQRLDAAIEKNLQELGYGEQGGLINA